jgi:hypothetical protein
VPRKLKPPKPPITVLAAEHAILGCEIARATLTASQLIAAKERRLQIEAIRNAMAGKTLTELRKARSPIEVLINTYKIGAEELAAVDDIKTAFNAVAGAGMIKSASLELRSPGRQADWSKMTAGSVENYRKWADFWSGRRTFGDRTADIVVRAIVHEHSFRSLEAEYGIKHGRGAVIAQRGLRDYAARSGWVTRRTADDWMAEALKSFKGTPLGEYGLAVRRAKRLSADNLSPPASGGSMPS